MTKTLSPDEAWKDFWEWIRKPEQAARWAKIGRQQQQYLYKAEIARKAGSLKYIRIKNILTRHAPERYTFTESIIVTINE